MAGLSGFSYAQARLQARYGKRAKEHVWLQLHNIHDFASYLQTAQQTSLRPWVLGISTTHNSHNIELILRQKYRQHVDEVAGWAPEAWQTPLLWIKRLPDLPVLQYLLANGLPMDWMESDSYVSSFTDNDAAARLEAMRDKGCASLVMAWQRGESMLSGWLSHWNRERPIVQAYDDGLQSTEKLLQKHLLQSVHTGALSAEDYEAMDGKLGTLFRRYAFQPAAMCAYLAMVAMDIHRLRSDLMRHVIFQGCKDHPAGCAL